MFFNFVTREDRQAISRMVMSLAMKSGMTPDEFADLLMDTEGQMQFMKDTNDAMTVRLKRKAIKERLSTN